MKRLYFLPLFCLLASSLIAQTWSGTTPGKIYYDQGNVGIGVTSPSALLHVGDGNVNFNTSDPNNAGLSIKFDKTTNNNGVDVDLIINSNSGSPIVDWYVRNWGGSYTFNRGSSTGKTKLFEINNYGDIFVSGGRVTGKNSSYISLEETAGLVNFVSGGVSRFSFDDNGYKMTDGSLALNTSDPNNAGLLVTFDKSTNNNGGDVHLTIDTNSGSPIVDWYVRNWGGSYVFNRGTNGGTGNTVKRQLFRIETNGNIVVPQGNAIIDGRVNSEEVKVEVLDIPDYVFANDYELRSLEDTKAFITQNKHLPEIPSEKEIRANGGIELGDMNMRLLKKIEELTLYQIQLMERLEELESKNAEIDQLKKEIRELKQK